MSEFGGLKFQVFNGGIARPAGSAKIVLYDGETVVDTYFTTQDGETQIITLPAPNENLSSEPDAEEKPFAVFNALVSFDGENDVFIEGIQVFPNVISIQRVDISNGAAEFITVPAPSLWAPDAEKIPEEEIKPLPEDEGFVVLDRVVVPEFVVV